jgi:transposase
MLGEGVGGMGKSIEITRQENTASELRRFAGKTEDGGQVRRLLGVALVLEGRARGEAAAGSGMDRQILCDWVHRYNAAGVAGLATGTRPGRPPSWNEVQMAELKELVIKGPDPELHKVVRWRCVDLCEEVARRYSVKVTKGTMGKWLRKLKLTRLQPRPHHPKKVAEAQEAFKKTSPA